MKWLLIIFWAWVSASSVYPCFAQDLPEGTKNTISFDANWRFHLGDIPKAKENDFVDSTWRMLDLPHDWSIEQPFDLNSPAGWRGAYLPGGVGWYRKTFNWEKDEKQQVSIQFDGVYMNSDVWINGHHLGKRPYGYISFQYDLSAYLVNGQNVISVRVDNSQLPSSRWYTGSGIYRHVKLTVNGPVYIPQWDTYITTPEVSKETASVTVQTEIQNRSGLPKSIVLQTDVVAPHGIRVARQSKVVKLDTGLVRLKQYFRLAKPLCWSTVTPYRYQLRHRILTQEQIVDEYISYFGVRNISVNAKEGFMLNGKRLKLNGVCIHHDGGPVGAAVPEDVLYRRLKLLKEMGCNAIRTAHNPAAPEFYTMCDTMGFMVLDEAFDSWNKPKAPYDYGLYFDEWWKKDLTDFIKRDRNHPSVVMWSIGNEVPNFEPVVQKKLVEHLKTLDETRPVTQARSGNASYLDVMGLNAEGEMLGKLEEYHREHPDKPILGTEMTHTLQTRGVYATHTWYRTRDSPAPWETHVKWKDFKNKVFLIPDLTDEEVFKNNARFYQSSYDNAIVRIGVRDQHKRTTRLNYLIGTFRWTGFDYLGEATVQPARTANFGILDLCGFPKDHYYLYQSLWSAKPMVHILPHWTHPGKEGIVIPVVVYTNAESAELFLNGKSLGEQKMGDELQLVWKVPYEKGVLTAVARKSGKTVAETTVLSARAAAAVKLLADKRTVRANKHDVVHVEVDVTDQDGVVSPESDNLIAFSIGGPGKIIGVENGDIADFSSMKAHQRKVFKGKCMVMIQVTDEPGRIVLNASSKGLMSDQVVIVSK